MFAMRRSVDLQLRLITGGQRACQAKNAGDFNAEKLLNEVRHRGFAKRRCQLRLVCKCKIAYAKPNLSLKFGNSEKCNKWTPAALASCLADWV